jgi:hypothetical protein
MSDKDLPTTAAEVRSLGMNEHSHRREDTAGTALGRETAQAVAASSDLGGRRDLTREELLALPAVVDLTTAAGVLGIGRTCA